MIDWVIEDEWAEWASITRWPKAGSLKVTATFSISSGWNLLVHRNCVYMEPKNTEVSVFEYSGVHAKTSVTLYSVELLSQRMLAGPNLLSNSDQTEDREARSRSHLMLLNSIFFHPPRPPRPTPLTPPSLLIQQLILSSSLFLCHRLLVSDGEILCPQTKTHHRH